MGQFHIITSVGILLALDDQWCNLVSAIHRGHWTREVISDQLRKLRVAFGDAFDKLLFFKTIDASNTLHRMLGIARLPECADCPDKFTCLTEQIQSIVRCRRCGVKWFYPVNTEVNRNGDCFPTFESRIVGQNSFCSLAVCGEMCPVCGYVDGENTRSLYHWTRKLVDDYLRGDGANPYNDFVVYIDSRGDPLSANALFGGQYQQDLQHYYISLKAVMNLLCKAKAPGVMCVADFADLLYPEPDVLRGWAWQYHRSEFIGSSEDPLRKKYEDAMLNENGRYQIVSDLASQWSLPICQLEDALSVRDKDDPCYKAKMMMENWDRYNAIRFDYVFEREVFGALPAISQELELFVPPRIELSSESARDPRATKYAYEARMPYDAVTLYQQQALSEYVAKEDETFMQSFIASTKQKKGNDCDEE